MVDINNLTTSPIDEGFLQKVAEIVLKGELEISKFRNIELSIALVGQGRIRELNKKYRGKNRTTDVLSFQYDDSGEIVICLSEIKKNAKRFNSTLEKELAKVLIHGILHLLGYNDEKSRIETQQMEKKENYYLEKIF